MPFDSCDRFSVQNYIARNFPFSPESCEAPEDADAETTDSRPAESEATIDDVTEGVERSEEIADDPADEATGFIMAPRARDVEEISDSDSNPEADAAALVDAAPSTSPLAAPKQPKGGFADEDDLFS